MEDEWLGPLINQIMKMNAKETKSDDEDFFEDQPSTPNNTNNTNK